MADEFSNKRSIFIIHFADGTEVTVEKPIEGVESTGELNPTHVYTREYKATRRWA